MTTYSKRRGRRSLAAILAAMLIASVLAVVAGSPAHAANTAGEVLVDHDNDAKTPMVRQFAGDTRYETALALAKDFAENNGGLGGLPVAFVASGESLVDAVAVSALAGDLNAPVLLTPGGELHRGVGTFLEDYGVGAIRVLGGPDAVSDAVVTAIKDLLHEPTVTRIAGDDRYATAAAIASALNGSRSWCDSDDEAAVLVNGGDTSLAGATVIGPVANRLAVPVLLTAADELPDATRDWIDENGIEHVVIVGSTADVSDGIAKMLTADGVDVVERIDGDGAGELSVNVAKTVTGSCADDLAPVAFDRAALVNGWTRDVAPDAITAAPVLSNGNLVPILLVGDTLPASVRDYLAATPTSRNGEKVHYQLLAIGGTAAVSDAVMAAAIAAASSADALSVSITNNVDNPNDEGYGKPPAHNAGSFTLRFSDRIGHDAADNLVGRLKDIVQINGVPASFAVGDAKVGAVATATESDYRCDGASVRIILPTDTTLKSGDVVSVAGSTLTIGAAEDQRTVVPTSVTVPADPVDNTGPKITIVGVEDQASGSAGIVTVTVASDDLEDGFALTTDNAATTDVANDGEVRATRGGKPLALDTPSLSPVTGVDGMWTTTLTLASTQTDTTLDAEWKAGDQIVFLPGALADGEGNDSPRAHGRVDAAKAFPKATAIRVSAESDTHQAAMSLADALTGGTAAQVTLTAKKDGNAGGVYGNGWTFRLRKASSHTAGDVNIVVSVDTKGRRVVATINSGAPTYGDLKAALDEHSAFAALFDVKIAQTTATESACASPLSDTKLVIADDTTGLDTAAPFAGGRTTMAAVVTFNGYIKSIDTTQSAALIADVLAGAAARGIDVPNVTTTAADDTTSAALVFSAPSKTARIEIVAVTTSADILLKPGQGRDRVVIDANTVATGYADDADDATDDTGNAESKLWMYPSNSVKAPA